MPENRSLRELELRSRILEAARELFAERPANRVSVRDIAERAGIQHSVVHRYFGTKADLIAEVARANLAVVHDALQAAPDATAAALAALEALEAFPLGVRATAQAVLDGEDPSAHQERPSLNFDTAIDRMAAERGVDPTDPQVRADALVAGVLVAGWPILGQHYARLLGLTTDDPLVRDALRRVLAAAVDPPR